MTVTTKIDYPEGVKVVSDTNKFTLPYLRFFQGVYDLQGASAGSIQFNANIIQSKNGSDLPNLNSNTVTINGVNFSQAVPQTNGVLVATSNSSCSFVNKDISGLGGPVGSFIHSFQNTVTGFIKIEEGTIGNSTSGATLATGDVYENLYKHIWETYPILLAPVVPSAGNTAQEDWDAGKPIFLPLLNMRVLVSTATQSEVGDYGGEAAVMLTKDHINPHAHTIYAYASGSSVYSAVAVSSTFTADTPLEFSTIYVAYRASDSATDGGAQDGSSSLSTQEAHENLQPGVSINMFMKL